MRNFTKRRGIVLFVLFMFMLSTVSQSMADTLTFTQVDKKEIIDINKTHQDEESIEWEVTFNQPSIENEGSTIDLKISDGLSKSSIDSDLNAEIKETAAGYQITTPAGSDTYTFKMATAVNEQEEAVHEVKAKVTVEDEHYEAFEQVDAIKKSKEEDSEVKASDSVDPATKENESTEDNEETKEVNTEKVENADSQAESDNTVPAAKNNTHSNSGTLNLDKVGTPTDKYAEWEVGLTVTGEDSVSTSDIVLVLDISSSMSRNKRFENMLKAAEELVNTVMTDSPNTRIALVEFDKNPNQRLGFTSDKTTVINSIRSMKMGSGTNIQGGIYYGRQLLDSSNADHKKMVLLSDGSPNYSYKASEATSHSWPDGRYNFALKNFNYNNLWDDKKYKAGSYTVGKDDHVIGTISEAKLVIDAGYDMYSIGLEVTSSNAIYTLENSQNKGYFPSTSEELEAVFAEIAEDLRKHAATDAVVTDPIGEMFNLVKDGSYNGANFEASHGTVEWDDASETFTWNIGTIKEGEVYSLKYKVTIDWDKNPEDGVEYPMNGDTPINFKDLNGEAQELPFPIPEGGIELGSLTINKTDENGEPLVGAAFELRDSNNEKISPSEVNDPTFTFENLRPNEEYLLVETKAPEGYRKMVDPLPIKFTKDNLHLVMNVKNTKIDENNPQPGDLFLNKVGTPTDNYAEWEIELTVKGEDLLSSTDIVLVLDISSSMSKNKRFENMIKAAKNLVEEVMTNNPNARISLVEYDATPKLRLDFSSNKAEVLNSINTMTMGNGTNIQGGIYEGRKQLEKSNADQKTMVLLTDGSANRSYKAASAEPYTGWQWPGNKYNFALKDFDYTSIKKSQDYKVDGYSVKDHYIGTISEAKLVMDQGFDMYSIGLEVSSGSATYTMQDSQNKGYYPASSDELESVFAKIAQDLRRHAATGAVVTDPIGDMFNLVQDGGYNGADYEASHGTVDWDEASETFTWNIGSIKQGELYSLKYKVTIDWDKNPEDGVDYPMNGYTPLNYKDPNGNNEEKPFPIPEGGINLGSLTVNKVDDGNKPLAGAEFELRDANDNLIAASTTENGTSFKFENLKPGTYTLIETKAPEGYRLLTKPITIEISNNDFHITQKVKNSKVGWELPSSGGIGTLVFYLLGIALMGSTIFYFRRRGINE